MPSTPHIISAQATLVRCPTTCAQLTPVAFVAGSFVGASGGRPARWTPGASPEGLWGRPVAWQPPRFTTIAYYTLATSDNCDSSK
jgi:hypothetical protein